MFYLYYIFMNNISYALKLNAALYIKAILSTAYIVIYLMKENRI